MSKAFALLDSYCDTAVVHRATQAVLLVVTLLLATPASADMAPPAWSNDAHCSLEAQCADGAECPSGIRQDAGAVKACEDAKEAKGLEYRCHRGGNYFGTAVYCRPGTHGSYVAPELCKCSIGEMPCPCPPGREQDAGAPAPASGTPAASTPPAVGAPPAANANPTRPDAPVSSSGGRCSISHDAAPSAWVLTLGMCMVLLGLRRVSRVP